MKHKHYLMCNQVGHKNLIHYQYAFGSTKSIKLTLSEKGFSISVALGKIYDQKEMLSSDGYVTKMEYEEML